RRGPAGARRAPEPRASARHPEAVEVARRPRHARRAAHPRRGRVGAVAGRLAGVAPRGALPAHRTRARRDGWRGVTDISFLRARERASDEPVHDYPPLPEALVVPVYDNHTHMEIADGLQPLEYRELLDRASSVG